MGRCILQWELSGACADENAPQEGLKDTAAAVAEEESDGYALDMRDGSDLERDIDFGEAADERRFPVSAAYPNGKLHALHQAGDWTDTIRGVNIYIHTWWFVVSVLFVGPPTSQIYISNYMAKLC